MSKPKNNRIKLFYSLVITLGTGAIAGLATASNIGGWYTSLSKPSFNPPNWIFGPTWTLLYILMGIALYLVWKQSPSRHRYNAISFFFIQLLLNFCWSFIFFYFHEIGLALADIIVLWVFIVITIISFGKHHKTAAALLIPYLTWVSFATILNVAIYRLN
jgi:benzodiazapine receptor